MEGKISGQVMELVGACIQRNSGNLLGTTGQSCGHLARPVFQLMTKETKQCPVPSLSGHHGFGDRRTLKKARACEVGTDVPPGGV